MSTFNNITLVKKANFYFDGHVTSRTVTFADSSIKTLGIMMPGSYEFNTAEAEIMEILAGKLTVLLPGEDKWQEIVAGQSFNVPANETFKVQIHSVTDYCCSYFK
ncbi:MAG: pyrimidine/purine nucleoside phosphorylase [Gammaproteobacteria bacterium]|nr:pyrimidine/purine nucleoside phosphorylase [Gammaproteobacteria bacterium]